MDDGNESNTCALKTDYLVMEGKEPYSMATNRRVKKHQRNKISPFN